MPSDDDIDWMRAAIDEADLALAHGDVPVGCVVVSATGRELARAHNRREAEQDPTAHAEIVALRAAARVLETWRLEGATVYVSLEPCPMCAGALVAARVARVVYATADPKAGALDSLFSIGRDTRLNHRFQIEAGVLAEQAQARLQDFFRARRAGSR